MTTDGLIKWLNVSMSVLRANISMVCFLLQMLNEEISTDRFSPILCPRASELIATYDEHVLVSTFKFGVLYQRYGQTTEEQLFSNPAPSPALDEFLGMLGKRIRLKEHKG